MTKDLNKRDYSRFDNLINLNGMLKEQTTYSFPVAELAMVNQDGNKQMEMLNITFEPGEHIEEVRRGMNKWATEQFVGIKADALWLQMGFYELMSDGMFRKLIKTQGSMTR